MRVIILSALCTGILSWACAAPRQPPPMHQCCDGTGAILNSIDQDALSRAFGQYLGVFIDPAAPIVVDERADSIDPNRRIIVRSVGEAYAFFREHLRARGIALESRKDGCLVIRDSAELRQAVWAYAEAIDAWADASGNNLANIQTRGFKRLSFRHRGDHLLPEVPQQIWDAWDGMSTWGVFLDWSSGTPDPTSRPLDLCVEGAGLFPVVTTVDGNDVIAYTRNGYFALDAEGQVVLADSAGDILEPPITIPQDTVALTVGRNGSVRVQQVGSGMQVEVGQIELARFPDPTGLLRIKPNLFLETDGSGVPEYGAPASSGLGAIVQGALEMSNVDPIFELIQLRLASDGRKLANEVLGTLYRTPSADSP